MAQFHGYLRSDRNAGLAPFLFFALLGLARFGGFSELKRSLRERPQLPVFGLSATDIGTQEDWYQGSLRRKHPPLGHVGATSDSR